MTSVDAPHIPDVDLADLEAMVGQGPYDRGRRYARGGRVLRAVWSGADDTLTGSVVGHGGLYETLAYFAAGETGAPEFQGGECSCPVGHNCKHVAALVIAAAGGRASAGPRPQPAEPTVRAATWERPLRALLDGPPPESAGDSLAFELSLQPNRYGGPPRLLARLLRPAVRGGWVNGSLTWGGLDEWRLRGASYRADHLSLARELHSLQRSSQAGSGWYGYANEKTIDLGGCGSRLWSLLDDAARIGLPLVGARGVEELRRYERGEVVIDVTRESAHRSLVRPLVRVAGDERSFEPVLFLGANGHGAVTADLRLVRLDRPVAAPLQRMVLDGSPLEVPADELGRFAEELCPELGGIASVVSSDGSFVPPEVSPPSLLLRARYGGGHQVEVGWEWSYTLGSSVRRVPLGTPVLGPGVRDVEAERALLSRVRVDEAALTRHGLLDRSGHPAVGTAELAGLDSVSFTTELLPSLHELSGVTVEVDGDPPDYRDVGESLEIGVATSAITGERDWFDLGVTIAVDGRELPFAEVFVALTRGESHLLLDDGAYFSLLDERLQSLRQLIDEARALSDPQSDGLRISRYQAALWSELAALGIVAEQAQAWQRQVEALLELDELAEHGPPATLAAELRPYQRDGFGWLASLFELELGGILADDMGLGKTLQTLALICHARGRAPDGLPLLVVAPTSVVTGWVAEGAKFAPGLIVRAMADTLAKSGDSLAEIAGSADLVVTTYTLLRLEADVYHAVEWAGVILDEAQAVKNHQTRTHKTVRELRAPFKLALTGTPMENNLMELWALLSVTSPGLFPDPKRFAEHYARPIERAGDGERLARLRRRVKPLVKRRTKELVAADLPPKQEQTVVVDLHPRHRKVYDTHLQRERQKILDLLGDFDRNRFTILRSITLLRQLSLHPGLVEPANASVPCAKLNALMEHLRDVVGGGHRALVFSQFTRFLAEARAALEREGIGYAYLDGRTRRRDRVLHGFKSGPDPVFLISLKAGGFGLNLSEADYCFLLDPWWNPAVENQAIDRAHRIGQTRPVMVYRLLARDTIEEKVVALAQRKADLFRSVLDDGDLFASRLTAEDIRGLLS